MISKLCENKVGYSDHTIGTKASEYAVAMGVSFIEKHFTVDPNLPGADHSMSADPKLFAELVKNCNNVVSMLGSNRTDYFECESDILQFKVIT